MTVMFEFGGSDMLLGLSLFDGFDEDGNELVIFSIGFLLGRIDFIAKK